MEKHSLHELHETLTGLVNRCAPDPVARCLADQLRIVLESLEGWDTLHGLLAGQEG